MSLPITAHNQTMANPLTSIPAETTEKRSRLRLRFLGLFLLAIFTGVMIAVWFYLAGGKQIIQPLQLFDKSPKGAEFEAANTTAPIYLYFNQPIDPASAVVEATPGPIRLTATIRPDRPAVLVLTPGTPWIASQTVTIIIKKNLVSPDKNFRLPTDITFQFTIKPLPRPIYDRPS